MGVVIDGAMQQAAQCGRQSMAVIVAAFPKAASGPRTPLVWGGGGCGCGLPVGVGGQVKVVARAKQL